MPSRLVCFHVELHPSAMNTPWCPYERRTSWRCESLLNDRLTLELSPSKAEDITRNQLGFAKHGEAIRRQQPEAFPPVYHDLAMAHHEAAEELAHVIPSQDFKQILLKLDRTLEACVACHRAFEQ